MNYPTMRMSDALSAPIQSVIETQQKLNANTLGMIRNHMDMSGNVKYQNYTIQNDDLSRIEIQIPELSMVSIPSLSIRKFNISMDLEDKKRDKFNNTMVSLSTANSRWKSYAVEMCVDTNVDPPLGLHRLNMILMESVKINKI